MASGARFKVGVEGLDTFLRQMDGWPDKVMKRVVKPALRSGARPIKRAAKQKLKERTGMHPTHRGPDYVPGTLQKSFTLRERTYKHSDGDNFIVVVGPSWAKAGRHAHLVEKGTAQRPHPITGTSGVMPSFKFMLDAFLETHDEVQDILAERLIEGMVRVIEGRL